ncbi:uncharacterized protein JCM6883_002309 [Sporobolomyces salmoneus]|uniref:uncharacterized protein n=1 Tax=Sporobolomyces salmoneus TaxID=183962 RepID=UPI00316C179B
MVAAPFDAHALASHRAANPSLRIRIVGAGIGGLAAALACARLGFTDVVVYENAPEIAEVGAGIQVAPNQARILRRLGVLEDLEPSACRLDKISLRRYQDNSVLGTAPLSSVPENYGAPIWVVHRADLQRVLRVGAEREGVKILTGHCCTDVNFEESKLLVKTAKGEEWAEGDVIIAADGIKSIMREKMLALSGLKDEGRATGDAAYRIIIPREKLEDDPELLQLVTEKVGIRWMGPGGHIMAYPIKDHQVYNMVLLHPDVNNTTESWTSKGSKKQMLDFYGEWCPTVQKLLNFVDEDSVMEWKLMDHEKLPFWIEECTALMGDACHPMLPYVAQGAAQAIEDGAVLGVVLSGVPAGSRQSIKNALLLYQEVRKSRAEAIQASAADTRISLHLPDGKKQQERDEKIRLASKGQGPNPDKWSDKSWQEFMWKTDCVVQANERLGQLEEGSQVQQRDAQLPVGAVSAAA